MFKVFPCGGDKRPLIKSWQTQASSDAAQIREWQETFRDRMAFFGIPTGKDNNLLVLDIDYKKSDGYASLIKANYNCPVTMSQRTFTGGMHLLYSYPTDGKRYGNRANVIDSIDIRGDGGYIICYGLDDKPIVEAPDWLKREASKTKLVEESLSPAGVSSSASHDVLTLALKTLREARSGSRNDTLNSQAFKVGQLVSAGTLDKELAYKLLYSVALEIGLKNEEIVATLDSALRGANLKPMTSPFGEPKLASGILIPPVPEREEAWTPKYMTLMDLTNKNNLRKPQLFKHWSTEDIHLTTADGGTGKTTLKLYEAVCLALGDRFLGFECMQKGKTLFITGEDTAEKLAAMVGQIITQMGIIDDTTKVNTILDSIIIKKDSELCLITKTREGFLTVNQSALDKVLSAVKEIKPKMIVFDPIASFWGSEAALNDMAKAVSKFMSRLATESKACVEMINHMGKVSSSSKDMSQFAGRGGTGLPSHARVSRAMREVPREEYLERTGEALNDDESCIMVNVSKFSDGSPLYGKPFLIIRKGFLFRRKELKDNTEQEKDKMVSDMDRVLEYVKESRANAKYPSLGVIQAHFMNHPNKLSKDRIKRALDMLSFSGTGKYKVKSIPNPDIEIKERVYILTDLEDREI